MFARAVTSTLVILAASCYRATAYQSPIPIEKVVTSYGYHLSSHDVVTPDGYILTMHRVSKPDAANTPSHSSPVILGHGLTTNSEQWLFRDDQSLVYLLVDKGFDVWLGNFRGSNHGRRHLTLSPQSHEFWDFSWHENGLIDQAAFIDHVLNVTGHKRLFTVSFSMSCTASMVLLSERPEYASKIIVNVFLAPPAFFRHPSGLWRLSKLIIDIFPRLIKDATGPNIVNDKLPFSDTPFGILCLSGNRNNLFTPICKWSAEFFAGKTSGFLSNKLMGLLFERTPAGASIRQMTHFGQSLLGGGFRKYDYGMAKNLELYGSRVPPSYNLTAITSPIDFYYGLADSSVSAKDAEDLSKLIPSIVSVHKVPKFNHFDFLFSAYLDEAVNKKILATFSSYL